jgi:hypothetical protein
MLDKYSRLVGLEDVFLYRESLGFIVLRLVTIYTDYCTAQNLTLQRYYLRVFKDGKELIRNKYGGKDFLDD